MSASSTIVLASVLKPVTDPRLLARLGRTLAAEPGTIVHIVAHRAADAPSERADDELPNVHLHPLFDFPRLSLRRLAASLRLLRKLRELQPAVLVVGTAELLPAALWWRWRTGGQLIYDVRENYALNLRTQGVFRRPVARALAWAVERVEAWAAPRLAGVLLAERSYAAELPWLPRCPHVAVIENKYQPPPQRFTPPEKKPRAEKLPSESPPPLRLLVSGTLSELYGTFQAVALGDALVTAPLAIGFELWLVGFCPLRFHYDKLKELASTRPWLRLVGGDAPVPHSQIIDAIRTADVGLMPYQAHPSLDSCVPTKLWEYIGEQLPVAVPPTPLWAATVTTYRAGFALDFDAPDAATRFSERLAAGGFYPAGAPAEAFWAAEAARLCAFFASLASPA